MTEAGAKLARHALLETRVPTGGWAYQVGGTPSVEPTVMACLALIASTDRPLSKDAALAIRQSADWLARLQRADGSLGVSADRTAPGWGTPYGILLWRALDGYHACAARATTWLLRQEGVAVPNLASNERVVGHDTSLVGWPWVAGTHSWIEPTALAVMALRRSNLGTHPRVSAAVHLIRDRAIAGGGWNYGNNRLFGTDLRPQPGPTGMALLALAPSADRGDCVEPALRYLQRTLPDLRAPQSLCWGALGLRAWAAWNETVERWAEAAIERNERRRDLPVRVAYSLLAASEASLELLGVTSIERVA